MEIQLLIRLSCGRRNALHVFSHSARIQRVSDVCHERISLPALIFLHPQGVQGYHPRYGSISFKHNRAEVMIGSKTVFPCSQF